MALTNLNLPSSYEYYTSGGISHGLSANQSYFTLNNKNITLYCGAMHYFRVPEPYWRDRLRKMRAAGLNCVETYVPWNLHEPQINQFDFGNGNSDMTEFLDIEKFLKTAQEEDLFAIVRPGPYICSEWEFGGLPSWLLREKNIKIRTSDSTFMKHVARYFRVLLQVLVTLQFTKGGPIIGFQVENEYGSTEWRKGNDSFVPDKNYIRQLRDLMVENGIEELLFTSDSPEQHGDRGSLPDLFQTANFARNPKKEFEALKKYQKNKPTMAMEFWTGWFDFWTEKHHTRNNSEFRQVLKEILAYPASVNFYMFHGGTNWGFLNGANIDKSGKYQPIVTSYDYDAPLSENGDYTEKYDIVKEVIEKHSNIKTKLPKLPSLSPIKQYKQIKIEKQLKYSEIINQLPYMFHNKKLVSMELLPFNNDSGQSYGYIIYRKSQLNIAPSSVLKIKNHAHDSLLILVDGILVSPQLKNKSDITHFGYWLQRDQTIFLERKANATLDIIVENWGRNNFGKLEQFQQFKGLQQVYLDDTELLDWQIFPMEFKKAWTNSLTNWDTVTQSNVSLNMALLNIEEPPTDTYIDMREWNTGIVIVNGFVLGRYMHLGPQQTLYLPAPLLKIGSNEIVIFEHFTSATHVSFSDKMINFI